MTTTKPRSQAHSSPQSARGKEDSGNEVGIHVHLMSVACLKRSASLGTLTYINKAKQAIVVSAS